MTEATTARWWPDIPLDLAGLVLRRLPAHVDRVRFAAVCPQWRVAAREVSLPQSLPLLALRDGSVYSLPGSEQFHLPACEGYTEASSNWLFFSHEDTCFLRDPFSNATVAVPPLSQVRIRYVDDELGSGSPRMETQDAKDLTLLQVKFLSPQLMAACIMFQGSSQIAVCRPGPTSWWTMMHLDDNPVFGDLTFHQGKLYALDHCKADLFSVDISIDHNTGDPWVSQVQRVISGAFDQFFTVTPSYVITKFLYMVELNGRLLIVRRSMYRRCKRPLSFEMGRPLSFEMGTRLWKNEFEVFEGDLEQSRWSRVTTIGDDQVLFLQRGCCKFVCISQYKLKGDRIFFLENGVDDEDEDVDMRNGDGDESYEERLGPCKVFDMKDAKITDSLPAVSWKCNSLRPTWLFPQGQE